MKEPRSTSAAGRSRIPRCALRVGRGLMLAAAAKLSSREARVLALASHFCSFQTELGQRTSNTSRPGRRPPPPEEADDYSSNRYDQGGRCEDLARTWCGGALDSRSRGRELRALGASPLDLAAVLVGLDDAPDELGR